MPGSLLVRFREGAPRRTLPRARLRRVLDGGVQLLAVDPAEPGGAAAMARHLSAEPDVAWAEVEGLRHGNGVVVNDPLYPEQWSLPAIHAAEAWARARGSASVVVAVVDSGLLPHPDLAGRLLPGYDFISDPVSAGDGDGRDDDASDAGAVAPGSSGLHGLHVGGIIGARPDNQLGMAGVDWRCLLLPVRVLGVNGNRGADSDIADGIRWAAGLPVSGVPPNPRPAQVINLSFGGPGGSMLLAEAIRDAIDRGAVVIASAGNEGADVAGFAPAGLDGVITVGATDQQAGPAGYSNWGARVALMAPGGGERDAEPSGILSTTWLPMQPRPWDYLRFQGTSQAAAHVSGVAALVCAVAPGLGGREVGAVLVESADSRARCDRGCGGGLIDAAAAVALASARAGCDPQCGAEQACAGGQCVYLATDSLLINGGGCRLTGPGGGRNHAVARGWWLILPGLLLRCRRARRSRVE